MDAPRQVTTPELSVRRSSEAPLNTSVPHTRWLDVENTSGQVVGHVQQLRDLPKLQIFDESTPSKPDNFRISPATPMSGWETEEVWSGASPDSSQSVLQPSDTPATLISGVSTTALPNEDWLAEVLADWSDRGAHVDFHNNEELPLVQGRFLGHGSMGGVFETTIRGHAFAWKRRYCRRGIGQAERKELDILRKVSHRHIIQLAGSYTHRHFLGLLLYPVATCDLATFLEDIEEANDIDSVPDEERTRRLKSLGLYQYGSGALIYQGHDALLYQIMGCIISAVAYLHGCKIRHKDLKPSNILLSSRNVWLTDFGTATDFSNQTVSTTENLERGTPKYHAPEMAAYQPNGRPADIFSLGCVLLEIHTLLCRKPEDVRELRTAHDRSFHANLDPIREWLWTPTQTGRFFCSCEHIDGAISEMLLRNPAARPTIDLVLDTFHLIDTGHDYRGGVPLFRNCCRRLFISRTEHEREIEHLRAELTTKHESQKKKIQEDHQQQLNRLRTELAGKHRVVELENIKKERVRFQEVTTELQLKFDWESRETAIRQLEGLRLDDTRAGGTSSAPPVHSSTRTLKKLSLLPPDAFSRPESSSWE